MIDLNIVIAGAAGEGIQTIGDVFSRSILKSGYPVFTCKEYESRIRGGNSSYHIRVSDELLNGPRHDADLLLVLNEQAGEHYKTLLSTTGIMLAETGKDSRTVVVPFRSIAVEQCGNKLYANSVAAGALCSMLSIEPSVVEQILISRFSSKGEESVRLNLVAVRAGYAAIQSATHKLPVLNARNRSYAFTTAHEVLPLAAAYAGCRFIAAYPMSPSTGIITAFARDEELGVFVEQVEDEIAAINMAIGASYAGARAMTATSGGGFALMGEGVSLAGMMEIPLVILIAQRPGPATGLPTRTAQEDLLFAIHSGHGEFPKAVIAPSDPQDIFSKTVRAFELAAIYQTPVILLTDQFLADSYFSYEKFDIPSSVQARVPARRLAIPEAFSDYKRYLLTADGISPRLYPGQSKHLVCSDSDEHNETGHITEDLTHMRPAMVQKRLTKQKRLQQAMALPEEICLSGAEIVLVSWGSTRGVIEETVSQLRAEGIVAGAIHFTEIWPLPYYAFSSGKKYISVEGNATGQLTYLLTAEYGLNFSGAVRRSDGLPITADYIRRMLDGYA